MITTNDLSGNGKGVGFVSQALLQQSLTAVGNTASCRVRGMFNAALSGTFVATVELQRSLDNGATWNDMTAGGYEQAFTGPCEEVYDEPENQALYRWSCKSYTSGTINCRISQ